MILVILRGFRKGLMQAIDPQLLSTIKSILRRDLKLGESYVVPDDMQLIGGPVDLDSIDILLVISSLEKHFQIKIPNEVVGRHAFRDVSTLTQYIQQNLEHLRVTPQAARSNVDWLARLPHGPEFRFISSVSDVVPGVRAGAVWNVHGNETFFAGHFPNLPIVPGVLIAEALAQVSGLCAASEDGSSIALLSHVDVRFEAPVFPPASIELRATLQAGEGPQRRCDVVASVGGLVVSRGQIGLVFRKAMS